MLIARFIADLGLDRHVGGLGGHGDVRGINIDAGGLEILVERQGLVNLAGDVQPDVAVEAAVVGIEILGLPLEDGAGGFFGVVGDVGDLDGEDVFLVAEVNGVGDVDAAGRDAVFVFADGLAVHEESGGLPHAFELDEDLVALGAGGKLEVLAVRRRGPCRG